MFECLHFFLSIVYFVSFGLDFSFVYSIHSAHFFVWPFHVQSHFVMSVAMNKQMFETNEYILPKQVFFYVHRKIICDVIRAIFIEMNRHFICFRVDACGFQVNGDTKQVKEEKKECTNKTGTINFH